MKRKEAGKFVNQDSEPPGAKDLPEDIWATIFSKLDHTFLFESAYCVSRRWRSICRLILFWNQEHKSINLQKLKKIGKNEGSHHHLVKLLDLILDELQVKSQTPSRLYFPHTVALSDEHLLHFAKRLPMLQILDLSCFTNMLTKAGFSRAICYWTEIENLIIGPLTLSNYSHVIQEIGINCKNLRTLCLHSVDVKEGNACVLDESTSLVIANSIPQLKVLMFKHFIIYKWGLYELMSKSTCLESICSWWCRHAHSGKSNDMYHCIILGDITYMISKCATKDDAFEWSMVSGDVHKKFNSYSSMTSYLWMCDFFESDTLLEWFPK